MIKFNTTTWNRKGQFDFFKDYEDPFFSISLNIDVTKLYSFCKENNLAFTLSLYYYATEAANSITEFRLRLKDGVVYDSENMIMGSTVLNTDNTFFFCYFPSNDSVEGYNKVGKELIENQTTNSVNFEAKENELAVIHGSMLPWFSYTNIKHARNGDEKGKGIPKFVFGKYFDQNAKKLMPFTIDVHHGLMDGYHVAQFLDIFQNRINEL